MKTLEGLDALVSGILVEESSIMLQTFNSHLVHLRTFPYQAK